MRALARNDRSFFERLIQWEHAEKALTVFDDLLAQPLQDSGATFHHRLYESLIDHLLAVLKLPRTPGAAVWEWKPLYRFEQETDPHYFTDGDIRRVLGHFPLLDPHHRQTIASVLNGYFQLRRQGFPEKFPSPLLPISECERWTRIFPPHLAWGSLDILRTVGMLPMGSQEAFRAYSRFSEGSFAPDPMPDNLRRWQSECWRGAISKDGSQASEGDPVDPAAPYRANFLASVFSGRFEAMGFKGVCLRVPDCTPCPLRDDCLWQGHPDDEQPGIPEVLALARRGGVDALRTDQLLLALFDLDEAETKRFKDLLAGKTLRQIADWRLTELKNFFGARDLLPERLRIAFELCKRFNEERMAVGAPFATAWDIFNHFRMRLRDVKQEQFIAVMLDNKRRYIDDRVITLGVLDSSPVHPREVFNAAIRESAAALVVVHNHPSGDPSPSREDIQITRLLMKAGELIGIPVLDHLIIADDRYVSLLEEGLLKT